MSGNNNRKERIDYSWSIFRKMKKKIKIGILETALHVEVLRNYALIFSAMEIQVHAILTPQANALMESVPDHPKLVWHLLTKPVAIKVILNKCDLVIFTTFDQKVKPYLKIQPPKYAVVHAFHRYFAPWRHFDFYIRPFRSIINLIRSLFSTVLSPDCMDGFIAGAPTVLAYLEEQSYFQKNLFYDFPFYLYEPRTSYQRLKKDPFKIVVPGSVHPGSRDYEIIYHMINAINLFDQQLEIILVGKPSGKAGMKIVTKMKAVKKHNLKIRCFTNYLPAEKYKQLITQADILLCPIPPTTVSGFTVEKNSYSHVSGNINDFVNYDKAIILPISYQLESGLEPAVLRYQELPDLISLIENLTSGVQSIPDTSFLVDLFGIKARKNHFQKELDRLLAS